MSSQLHNGGKCNKAYRRTVTACKICCSKIHSEKKRQNTRFYRWVAGVFIATIIIVDILWFAGLLDVSKSPIRH